MSDIDQTSAILIFGASCGIGSSLARRLGKEGHRLALVARDPSRLNALAEEVGAFAVTADTRDSAAVANAFTKSRDELGPLNGVAHCVGSLLLKPAHIITDEAWTDLIQTNLTSSFFVLREAVKHMRNSGGSLVFTSSAAALRGMINHEAIAAAKAGIIGMALAAAASYARSGIRVNCVAPGLTDTPLTTSITQNEAAMKASTALHPLGRIGTPNDVASAIAWLLNPEQSWVTGQVLGVDGGLAKVQPRLTLAS